MPSAGHKPLIGASLPCGCLDCLKSKNAIHTHFPVPSTVRRSGLVFRS